MAASPVTPGLLLVLISAFDQLVCNELVFVQVIAKYMPTAEPMLDTTVYELVLKDFLINNQQVSNSVNMLVFIFKELSYVQFGVYVKGQGKYALVRV
jgi:hypothetical protein